MKIYRNDKLIQRNSRLGAIITLTSLATLGSGLYISFVKPELFNYAVVALLVGFILSQAGIYLTNRWGRKPRIDEILDQALKGLDAKYTLYHYLLPAAHVLIGPAGIWVFNLKHQRGTIKYYKNRWRQKGGGLIYAYLKIFAQEGIGRPDLEIESDIDALEKHLKKQLPDLTLPPIQAALVFFNPEAVLEADDAPNPTLYIRQLKEFIRKQAKAKPVSMATIQTIQNALEQPTQ